MIRILNKTFLLLLLLFAYLVLFLNHKQCKAMPIFVCMKLDK